MIIKKKLLFVTPYFSPENFPINSLVFELASRGEKTTVLTGLPNYRNFGFYKNYSFFGPYVERTENLKIIRVPVIPRFSNSKVSIFLFYLSFFISSSIFLLFFSILNRNKYKHIMAYCTSPVYIGILTVFFSKILNCKNSQWIQDIWPEAIETTIGLKSKKLKKIINLLQSYMWNKSDILFAQSEDLKNYLVKNTKCSNIETLYNPVRQNNIVTKDFLNVISNNVDINITFMGTVGKGRSINLMLDAFNKLDNDNIYFNICGTGSEFKKLQNLYNYNKIVWHGWLEDEKLDSIAKKTDFFIFGLENKGRQAYILPSKIQTYCKYSKPVICISNGAPRSLVEKFNIGIVSKSNSINDIKDAIILATKMTDEEKKLLSNNSFRLFENFFSQTAVTSKFQNTHE